MAFSRPLLSSAFFCEHCQKETKFLPLHSAVAMAGVSRSTKRRPLVALHCYEGRFQRISNYQSSSIRREAAALCKTICKNLDEQH